jgi:outer membrane protein OmpA-like peptidoglycan-associated protein
MKFRCMFRAVLTLSLVVLGAATMARAQETGEDHWPRWWYGIYGGANINLFSGALHEIGTADSNVADPTGFDKGSGLGLALGGIIEYNSGGLLGGNLMLGYDNRSVGFDTKNATASTTTLRSNEKLDAHLAYFTVEPNVRINLGSKLLHLMLGPSFRILVAKSYDYTFTQADVTPTGASSADFANIRSFIVGGQAGVGYDIPLSNPDAHTQILLTPFAQFHITQDLLDGANARNEFKVNTVRAGIELKFGTASTTGPGPDVAGAADFSVRAPNVVTESRKLNETFPIRNYIFFDEGSTDIPARYKRVSSGDSFREDQLIKPAAETGGADAVQIRSRRQMEVYYQVMNVFGDRLRRNPNASIKLTGSANGDVAAAKKMADNVKNYLVTTFGVDAKQITTQGAAMPTHKSGTGSSQGEDRKMIDAENYRVEIEGTPDDIMQPVKITSVQEEPVDNDIVFTIPPREDIAFWNVEITERGGQPQTFGPYRNVTTARIDSKALLGTRRDARYTSKVIATTKSNQTLESPEKEFRLVHADADEEQTGTRYSILFEFDDSKTVQTYESFLANTVAPAIPNGASVIIHGHTDVTGDPDYNAKLSQRRSDEAQKILTRELTKAGKAVTFDTYGFGEDERRSPFNNTLPEQRYYNRTVVIEVVPGH